MGSDPSVEGMGPVNWLAPKLIWVNAVILPNDAGIDPFRFVLFRSRIFNTVMLGSHAGIGPTLSVLLEAINNCRRFIKLPKLGMSPVNRLVFR